MRLITALLLLTTGVLSVKVNISNTEPRRDTDGDIIAAGDGCISYHPDEQKYYLFGAHYQPCPEPDTDCYCGGAQGSGMGGCPQCEAPGFVPEGECCGWRNATIAAYSSPDLVTWTKEGLNILPILTADPSSTYSSNHGAIFEACGIFNRNTGFWMLYFLRDGYILANAVSRTASGPFNILNYAVPVPGMSRIVDHYYWQNATTGELLLKHNGDSGEFACTMSGDYLGVSNCSAMFGHELGYTEGGGIFQHSGETYVMAGYGCCFCTLGSNGFLWKSDTPLGEYTLQGDFVARNPDHSSVTHSQQFSVTPVYTATGPVPMFIGIRFGSSPERVKSTDFQFWAPLTFDPATGRMNNVTWVDSFELDLEAPPPPPPLPGPPPPPYYACSLTSPGQCVEVPHGAPGTNASLQDCQAACQPWYACGGSATGTGTCTKQVAPNTPGAFPTQPQCTASCVACDLAGLWFGNVKTVDIHIESVPPAGVNIYTVPSGVWTSNATGTVGIGEVTITGGWCGGAKCTGVVSPLEEGGPSCAQITWGAGTWCNPAVDSKCVR
jgi:hypothetical protein